MSEARAYRGVALADRVALRREALIEAGLDCLYEDGLAALSVRAVCARSKLTARYFYESFSDLDALLGALVDACCVEVAEHALAAIGVAGETLPAKVRAAVGSAYAVLSHDPRKAAAFLLGSAAPEALQDRRDEWMTQYVQLVLTNLPLPTAASLEAKRGANAAALFVMGGTTEMLRAVLSGSLALSDEDVVERLTAMWLAVLG
ncbi:TetR family transcriptional regulator [Jatrophihabitans sp.]|uniref:TetR/AcrR family transcriptional regulator n=1 Tax=Jatrophihabitans sp. TaxID=1932789 RepID=UPI0030C71D67|nr:TetR family transcriptional regulator [Jatrophihabitans sp.]